MTKDGCRFGLNPSGRSIRLGDHEVLDGIMRRAFDPSFNHAGHVLAKRGVLANHVTLIGLALGLLAAGFIAFGVAGWVALVPLLASRVADGLDGAVARASCITDFGGYLDIVCDFIFYGAIPLAFVLRDPSDNGVAGAVLLTSFYANGASFLSFAILAAKRGMQTEMRGIKSLYFTAGLLEGTETIAFFVIICIFPSIFVPCAWVFGVLCFVTALSRIVLAWQVFGKERR
jgi:phosphatidylglycerophosphate synthase